MTAGPEGPERDARGSSETHWVVAVLVLLLATVLPLAFFMATAFSEDETATQSPVGALIIVVPLVLVIGGVLAALAWAGIRNAKSPSTRPILTTVLLIMAAASGLVTGFLGGAAIALERHPMRDDA